LVATNGQIIATSEAYESEASALKGIESVNATPPTPRSTTGPTVSLHTGLGCWTDGVQSIQQARTISSWGLGDARLGRRRIQGDVIECGEDFGSEMSERQGSEPQRGRVELSVGQPGDALAGLGSDL
jgi:Domain of unknown function (DUF1508)